MSHISFYHTINENQNKSVCQLLEKCYQSNFQTLVRVGNIDIQESINNTLWTFAQKSFIPHGSASDPHPNLQPIYITTGQENPNQAIVLMLIGTLDGIYDDNFERIIVIFDSKDEKNVTSVKTVYDKLSTPNNNVKYYIQDNKGMWEQKLFN